MTQEELRDRLNTLCERYERVDFIEADPISIPHMFSRQQDIETAAFLAATIAWGNRTMIVRNARSIVERMDGAPHDFVMGASDEELCRLDGFVHRTFNDFDLRYFVLSLRSIFAKNGSVGAFFEQSYATNQDLRVAIGDFRTEFLREPYLPRTSRHISNIASGSACKRLCMMLRWMVRSPKKGVDFGLWSGIPTSALYIPLDVHAARQGRALGLLTRRQDDWRAVEEFTQNLRAIDPIDPIRYDFALFGLGVDKSAAILQ